MITHWFIQEDKSAIRPERLSKSSLWHEISFLHEDERPLTGRDLLLISLDRTVSRRVKKQLYQFSKLTDGSHRVVDCGLLNQKQPESIMPILQEISDTGAVIILLGAPMSFMRYQVSGSRMVSIIRESNLDDDIHLRTDLSLPMIQYIGTQRHLVSEVHQSIEGHLRLSDVNEDISLAEPCIRDSEVMIFHCDSLSAFESGYMTGMSASGLRIVDACQLFRYAGAAQALSTIGIYGYSAEQDEQSIIANALAQMIWYLLEGTTLREDPEDSLLTKYVVQSKDNEHTLLFFKSEITGRWWIQNKTGRKVPCSFQDYRKACEEDYSPVVIKSAF